MMKKVLIIYHSQQKGNTKKAAKLVARGCRQVSGTRVELINTNDGRVDMDKATAADAWALGTPDYASYMAGGLKQFFDDLILAMWSGKIIKNKPCVAFVTHGGKGKAVASVENMIRDLELRKIGKTMSCEGSPKGKHGDRAVALGKALAACIQEEA